MGMGALLTHRQTDNNNNNNNKSTYRLIAPVFIIEND